LKSQRERLQSAGCGSLSLSSGITALKLICLKHDVALRSVRDPLSYPWAAHRVKTAAWNYDFATMRALVLEHRKYLPTPPGLAHRLVNDIGYHELAAPWHSRHLLHVTVLAS